MIPVHFLNRITLGDSCWEWVGDRYRNGYGKYYDRKADGGPGRHVLAHRFIYSLMVGEISGVINHRCENKACVRPDHLEDVTQQQNVRYSLSDTCTRGHDLTRGNPNVWLSADGRRRKCRTCMRENKRRAYWGGNDYALNRAAVLEQKRDYYTKNREAILSRRRARYAERITTSTQKEK